LGRYGRAVNWRAGGWRARAVPGKPRTAAATVGALALGLLSGCGLAGGPGALGGDAPEIMTVTSPMLDQGAIERQYTCDGPGETPPISWSGMPARTKSVAIVMDDSAAPITPRMYWIVFDISPSTSDLEPGNLPDGARVARNSAGPVGRHAPLPVHRLRPRLGPAPAHGNVAEVGLDGHRPERDRPRPVPGHRQRGPPVGLSRGAAWRAP
jgi:hypothetical protein